MTESIIHQLDRSQLCKRQLTMKFMLSLTLLFSAFTHAQVGYKQLPYDPLWLKHFGQYEKTPFSKAKLQPWLNSNHVIDGWDFSYPENIQVSPHSKICIARSSTLENDKKIKLLADRSSIAMKGNFVVSHWFRWKSVEKVEGVYDFSGLKRNIAAASAKGYKSVVRMHTAATDFAPQWLAAYKPSLMPKHPKKTKQKINYDPGDAKFHSRYLKLVNALGASGITQSDDVVGLYVGYASPSNGDEGIAPHQGKDKGKDPDSFKHVRERLDAWAKITKGVEHKVYMGGVSNYGFAKGFGTRRGFVEMFYYHIPSSEAGQMVTPDGYLAVDEDFSLIKNNAFYGEENEEYEESWTKRFGHLHSFTFRYFMSSIRNLQMRTNYLLHNEFTLNAPLTAWTAVNMGKDVNHTNEAWAFLNEADLKQGKSKSKSVKNMERWLYQRDDDQIKTQPAFKVQHPIAMWTMAKDKHFSYLAKTADKIGFAIDDRFIAPGKTIKRVMIKVSYLDSKVSELAISNGKTNGNKTWQHIKTVGDNKIKTVSFILENVTFNGKNMLNDFYIESDKLPISLVRIINLDK